MKINHNNRNIDVTYGFCSNCYFHEICYLCAILPACWVNAHIYKISTKNSDIFNI